MGQHPIPGTGVFNFRKCNDFDPVIVLIFYRSYLTEFEDKMETLTFLGDGRAVWMAGLGWFGTGDGQDGLREAGGRRDTQWERHAGTGSRERCVLGWIEVEVVGDGGMNGMGEARERWR